MRLIWHRRFGIFGRVLVACALVAGCRGAISSPTPSPYLDPCDDFLCIQYDGRRYVGHVAQSDPNVTEGRGSLWIADENLTEIGVAAKVKKDVGPDLTVYSVALVDPTLAIVTFDGIDPEVTVWTIEGRDPTTIPGLCQHFLDPTLRLCDTDASPGAST